MSADDGKATNKTALSPRASDKIDNRFIKDLLSAIVRQEHEKNQRGKSSSVETEKKDGAILVFLPGRAEIESLARVLYDDATLGNKDFCKILKLHSAIPRGEQQFVFKPALVGTVKVVLATNIAGKQSVRFVSSRSSLRYAELMKNCRDKHHDTR